MKQEKLKHASYDEILNFAYDQPLMTVKATCEKFSLPVKTFKTWQYRDELKHPIIIKVKGSRRIVVQPQLFAEWFVKNKCGSAPTVGENRIIYSKQINAMTEGRAR